MKVTKYAETWYYTTSEQPQDIAKGQKYLCGNCGGVHTASEQWSAGRGHRPVAEFLRPDLARVMETNPEWVVEFIPGVELQARPTPPFICRHGALITQDSPSYDKACEPGWLVRITPKAVTKYLRYVSIYDLMKHPTDYCVGAVKLVNDLVVDHIGGAPSLAYESWNRKPAQFEDTAVWAPITEAEYEAFRVKPAPVPAPVVAYVRYTGYPRRWDWDCSHVKLEDGKAVDHIGRSPAEHRASWNKQPQQFKNPNSYKPCTAEEYETAKALYAHLSAHASARKSELDAMRKEFDDARKARDTTQEKLAALKADLARLSK